MLITYSTMPLLYPTQSALNDVFSPHHPLTVARPKQPLPKPDFSAWSVAEDAKNKATQLSNEATKEIQKASEKAQVRTGHIELYSGKYYAACIFGGLVACVGMSE